MAAMEKAGIKKLSIKEKTGFELHLERHEDTVHLHAPPASREIEGQPRFPTSSPPLERPLSREEGQEGSKQASGKYVTSPMVGTFYASSSPDDPHFVKVGDRVDENTVVCIIEAMKVMNEVKAGLSGVIAEVCVNNAQPVEFGTKMFRIV